MNRAGATARQRGRFLSAEAWGLLAGRLLGGVTVAATISYLLIKVLTRNIHVVRMLSRPDVRDPAGERTASRRSPVCGGRGRADHPALESGSGAPLAPLAESRHDG